MRSFERCEQGLDVLDGYRRRHPIKTRDWTLSISSTPDGDLQLQLDGQKRMPTERDAHLADTALRIAGLADLCPVATGYIGEMTDLGPTPPSY